METNLSYKTHLEIGLRSYSTDGLTDSSAPELNTTGGIEVMEIMESCCQQKIAIYARAFFNVILPLWKEVSKRYN